MMVQITSELHAQLLAEAASSPLYEVCGLLTGRDQIEAFVPTANVSANPQIQFEIDPVALFAAIRTERAGGPKLLGHYHSHPKGLPTPSLRDHSQAAGDGRIWLIIGHSRVSAWTCRQAGTLEAAELVIGSN